MNAFVSHPARKVGRSALSITVGCCLLALMAVTTAGDSYAQQPDDCAPPPSETPVLPSRVFLKIHPGEQLGWRMLLGGGRNPIQTPPIRYIIETSDEGDVEEQPNSAVLDDGALLPVTLGSVTRKHDGVSIPRRFLTSEARVRNGEVHLKVCINPETLSPGVYLTSARITSSQIDHEAVGLEIAQRENRAAVLIGLLVASWLLGAFMLWLRNPSLASRQGWREYVLLVVGGMIGSLVATQNTLFVAVDFGKSVQDFLQTFVASLAAFLLGEGVAGTAKSIINWSQKDTEGG
jgi:hypothetical protein